MRFAIRAFTDVDADAVASWRYPPPYDVYDVSEDPSLDEEMRDPTRWGVSWFAVDDEASGEIAGFLELVASESESGDGTQVEVEIEIGLGLRPDLTGRGIGVELTEAGLRFSRERWNPRTFALDVFPWNERAIRCYEKVGFERGEVYVRRFASGNEVTFLRMARPA
ncbi:MAG: GNAT family N-acetyltransferase [Actinomycetota bacterium]